MVVQKSEERVKKIEAIQERRMQVRPALFFFLSALPLASNARARPLEEPLPSFFFCAALGAHRQGIEYSSRSDVGGRASGACAERECLCP